MSKRFGRNQKRKLREEVAHLNRRVESVQWELAGSRKSENEANARYVEGMRAARMARDSIRIDINSLVDPRERNIRLRARFDNMSLRGPELYAAYDIGPDEIIRRSDLEREAFVKLVGEEIATHALEQIIRHWRAA